MSSAVLTNGLTLWGDSFAQGGSGGGGADGYFSLGPALRRVFAADGQDVAIVNQGIEQQTSSQVTARFLARDTFTAMNVFWMGRNDIDDPDAVIANFRLCIANLQPGESYAVVSIHNFDDGTEAAGTPNYSKIIEINNKLAINFPGHYVDTRSAVVSGYNPGNDLDQANHARDEPAKSLTADYLHLNSAGTAIAAELIENVFAGEHNQLTVRVSGDAYAGDALFNVKIDGRLIGIYDAYAIHSQGEFADVVVSGAFSSHPSRIEISLYNDDYNGTPGTDRNLYVQNVTLNGHVFQASDALSDVMGGSLNSDGYILPTSFGRLSFVNGETGSPLVDDYYYLFHNKDVFTADLDPNIHYDYFGWHDGRDPNAFFSTSGYLGANQDVKAAGLNPLGHYDAFGWKDGRDPSANFDTTLYLQHNADVKEAGIDPLAHFLQYGQAEGRQAYAAIGLASSFNHGSFDAEFYLLSNPDVAKAVPTGANANDFAYNHYEAYGWHEGRNPNAIFDVKGYLDAYADVKAANIDPLGHYDTFGFRDGRDPSGAFDTNNYLSHNADVAAAQIDPLLHYLQYGAYENRATYADGTFFHI